MKHTTLFITLLSLFSTASAFASSFNETNNPANMNPHYNYHFDSLPQSGSLDLQHMPWSDNYWESDWGGISLRWNTFNYEQLDPEGSESLDKYSIFRYVPPSREQVKKMSKEELKKLSPAEKYDILMGRYDYPTVRSERGRTGPDMDDWQGICHGWVPASINHPEPAPTEATNADGVVVPFGSTDVKGLLSYYYAIPTYDYSRGSRRVIRDGNTFEFLDQLDSFDVRKWLKVATGSLVFNSNGYSMSTDDLQDAAVCAKPENIARYGSAEKCKNAYSVSATVDAVNLVGQVGARPDAHRGGVSGLSDPNPGAFHVVMANQLGLMHRAFIGDINKKMNSEIWNQPIVGYSTQVRRERHRRRRHTHTVEVTTTLTYVSEVGQMWEPVVGTSKQRFAHLTFNYTLELDDGGNITGGEWKSHFHPNFVWKHDKLEIKGYWSKLNEIYHPRF